MGLIRDFSINARKLALWRASVGLYAAMKLGFLFCCWGLPFFRAFWVFFLVFLLFVILVGGGWGFVVFFFRFFAGGFELCFVVGGDGFVGFWFFGVGGWRGGGGGAHKRCTSGVRGVSIWVRPPGLGQLSGGCRRGACWGGRTRCAI